MHECPLDVPLTIHQSRPLIIETLISTDTWDRRKSNNDETEEGNTPPRKNTKVNHTH